MSAGGSPAESPMQWDSSLVSVTPAVSFLSRCVSTEVLSQEEIDSAYSQLSPAFSSQLHTAEQQIRMQRQLEQVFFTATADGAAAGGGAQRRRVARLLPRSQVPGAADVLRSPAAPPDGAERSEAEAGPAAGPHQPAGPGPPAQVSGGAGAAAAGLHGDAGGEAGRSPPRSGPGGGVCSAGLCCHSAAGPRGGGGGFVQSGSPEEQSGRSSVR
ncbi:HAUS augmin-like complex subunit 2 isoform 1-T1 [Spinachia spinachia]